MSQIYQYKTVVQGKAKDLDREVNELLNFGWKLYGDPYSAMYGDCDGSGYRLFQALVREIPIDESVNNE